MTDGYRDPTTVTIATFLRGIGLNVRTGTVAGPRPLPGIDIDRGVLIVDEEHLLYPGDLLHEAGHLAVATPERRATFDHNVGDDAAEEMMAISWSYAAALHLQIDPAIVFHEHGYRGGSASLLENFRDEKYLALPMLQWVGLAYDAKRAAQEGALPFPHMLRWLRKS